METRTITSWAEQIHALAVEKGWWDRVPPGAGPEQTMPVVLEKLLLVHSEISEAVEELRAGHWYRDVYYRIESGGDKPEGFPVEIADAVIRLLDLCWFLAIDLENVVAQKHAYNKTRAYRHGGKTA